MYALKRLAKNLSGSVAKIIKVAEGVLPDTITQQEHKITQRPSNLRRLTQHRHYYHFYDPNISRVRLEKGKYPTFRTLNRSHGGNLIF